MTNEEILNIAMSQSAIDSNCKAEDFKSLENKIVISRKNPNARKYLELPFSCDLTSYGNNIVASVSEELVDVVKEYIEKYEMICCFETPNLHFLIEKLKPYNLNMCFMAEYFLPDVDVIKPLPCLYKTKLLKENDLKGLDSKQWSNALCCDKNRPDVLGVGAYDNDKLIGLAACSADCDTMWQIGVDVLLQYRRMGIASSLTSKLSLEILKNGKVPFYCCAWSNIKSIRNALKSGFKPAWVSVTAKPNDFINKML